MGDTVRVYRVSLAASDAESLEKELLVDLADCPPSGAESPGTQVNPLLDNVEALTLGPRLPGGRRSLLCW